MTEARLDLILEEVAQRHWDVLVLVETWREAVREEFVMESGHSFYGSGGSKGRCGVGFIVHERHGDTSFKSVNERLAAVSIVNDMQAWSIFAVYMPHSGHADHEVEALQEQISNLLSESRRRRFDCVLAGDFNAQVGSQSILDDCSVLGPHAFRSRTSRGDMLVQWCTLNNLALANTFFNHGDVEPWTYRNDKFLSQLDYIIVDKRLMRCLVTCMVCPDIDTGSGHRAVLGTFQHRAGPSAVRRQHHRTKRWKVDVLAYHKRLDTSIATLDKELDMDAKQKALEEVILDAAAVARTAETTAMANTAVLDQAIHDLISLRRSLLHDNFITAEEKTLRRKKICKETQKLARKRARHRKTFKIQQILGEFRGLSKISAIKGAAATSKISAMTNCTGEVVEDAQSIADVFASFYETLYRSQSQEPAMLSANVASDLSIEAISLPELVQALKGMNRDRAKDESGIIAEMLKDGSSHLLETMLELFNDVVAFKCLPPAQWKRSKLVVIFKKGDRTFASNYRPIAILPIMYKVFSRILCKRLEHFLIPYQGVEQAAYRKGFSTEDHMFTVAQVIEKSTEYNYPVWLVCVDFEKAFDMIEHTPLWRCLEKQSVPSSYVTLLKSLYAGQTAAVQTSLRSRDFSLSRGVQQGDPLSALLFIAVMQSCFDGLHGKWEKANSRRRGLKLGLDMGLASRNLFELRFADDVLLFARQWVDAAKMLKHLSDAAAVYGLKINYAKTKVLTSSLWAGGRTSVQVDDRRVQVLVDQASERYLGRQICFSKLHDAELQHRIAAGWAAFHKHKGELCGKFCKLEDRLKLFESVGSPVVLYGAPVWALTKSMEKQLHTTWRKMLRYVFRLHRRNLTGCEEESWIDYLQRTARRAETLATLHGLDNWVHKYREKKWHFARRVAAHTDGRWSNVVLNWRPNMGVGRYPGRPFTRWLDCIENFAGGNWRDIDEDQWRALEDGFITNIE